MSNRTKSERYFEKICTNRGVVYERIPETITRSPDYRVLIPPMELITEVKQLDPNKNDEEHREHRKTWSTQQSPGGHDATRRVRDKLADGYHQVKRLSGGKFPTMIVVYNNAGEWNLLDKFTISTAMFGSYGFVYESLPDRSMEVIRRGHLGNRRVQKDRRRYLSVVGVLERKKTGSENLELCCYHNPFTKVPIEPNLLAKLASNQYCYDDPHEGTNVWWEPKQIKI